MFDFCAAQDFETLQKPMFWKLATNVSVHVRAAFYTAVRTLTVQAPSLLQDAEAVDGGTSGILKLAGQAVMQGLSDKDAAAHSQMWECVLVFCRAFPSVLANMDLNKAILPCLFTLVKNGAFGSAAGSFPCRVPFADLCKLPIHPSPRVSLDLTICFTFKGRFRGHIIVDFQNDSSQIC